MLVYPTIEIVMNTSIHIPNDIAKRLDKHIQSTNCQDNSRNAFIVKAIKQRLNQVEVEGNWSQEILDWQGADIPIEKEQFTGFGIDLTL